MEELDFWRLAHELTVVQAAVLIAGDPEPATTAHYVEGWGVEKRPRGYEAAKQAISRALLAKHIKGTVREIMRPEPTTSFDDAPSFQALPDTVDPETSMVDVQSLRDWLKGRGFNSGFFFPADLPPPDFLDPKHPRYAPKLAAAVGAWRAMNDPTLWRGTSPKQALMKWLRVHAAEFELADDDGRPNETGIEEIAKAANWAPGGGAPKTPSPGDARD